MSKRSLVRWIVLPVTMVAVSALLGQSVIGATQALSPLAWTRSQIPAASVPSH